MAYTILRTAKLKTMGEIGGSLAHTYRTRETPNADPARARLNEHQLESAEVTMQAIQARLPESRRKNAVLAIEYFIGASPEFFEADQSGQDYFEDALKWLRDKHGADNVIAGSVHRDEKSPHLVVYVVPLDAQGKLNARQFLGGKATLSAMQTDFAKQVGQRHGLQRGIEGSKATHTTIKEYYSAISAEPHKHWRVRPETVIPKILKKRFLTKDVESPEQIADRVSRDIQQLYAPAIKEAGTARLQARRADEMAKTAEAKDKALKTAQRLANEAAQAKAKVEGELKAYKSIFTDGLTPEQQRELIALAQRKQATNVERAELERKARMTPEMREHEARVEADFQRSLKEAEQEEADFDAIMEQSLRDVDGWTP